MNGFIGEVLPQQKLEKIKELQTDAEIVAITGDGVNDAPDYPITVVGIAWTAAAILLQKQQA